MKTAVNTFIAISLAVLCMPVLAGEASQFSGTAALVTQPQTMATFNPNYHYKFYSGWVFYPRTRDKIKTYGSYGCAGSDDFLVKDLQLPQGASLQDIKLFYKSPGPGTNAMDILLFRYDGMGGSTTMLGKHLATGVGFHDYTFSTFSPTRKIDNAAYFYQLAVRSSSGVKLCGLRVHYVY